MVVLDELIKETKTEEIDKTLKKAFSALSEPIHIDGREYEALLFLINRTIKDKKKSQNQKKLKGKKKNKKKVKFLNKASLKLLKDEQWRHDILMTAKWIHTHNLKYPYSKADGCIFYCEGAFHHRKCKILGYAKDSKQINKCQFLVTEFLWKDSVTSLVEQFAFYSENDSSLVGRLIDFGLPEECIPVFQEKCLEALKIRLPDRVHQHCKQVRFFQADGKSIAVTPVVSTQMQRTIHNLTKDPDIFGTIVFHDRPSSLGTFVSACGGRVRCLNYPPRLGSNDRSTDYLIRQWRYKHHLLNEKALYSKQAVNLLFEILRKNKDFSTYQAAKLRREERMHRLEHLVEELFSDILILKSKPLSEYPELSKEISGSVEKNVIMGDFDHEQAASHFTRQIHELLERSKYSQDLAYQPALIEAVANGVRSFFKKESSSRQPEDFIYLHFERLLAYGSNCQSSPYLVGLPSLTAFAGLVEAFLLKLGVTKKAGFAIGLRSFARRKGHPLAKQICKNHVVRNDTVIDSQHCDIEFDLIIRLDASCSDIDCSKRNLYRCLPRRFAGGILSSTIMGTYQKPFLFKRCNIYRSNNELTKGLCLLPSFTRFIADADTSYSNLSDLPEVLKVSPTLLPVNKGFKLLGGLCQREGAIADLHAYAGHILSLIELLSPGAVIAFPEAKKQIFWNIHVSKYSIELLSGESNDRAM